LQEQPKGDHRIAGAVIETPRGGGQSDQTMTTPKGSQKVKSPADSGHIEQD
jgi:hypothetical protein